MFISKKKYEELIERIDTLSEQVNGLMLLFAELEKSLDIRVETTTTALGKVNFQLLCRMLPKYIDKRAAAVFDSRVKKIIDLIAGNQ